MFLASLMRWKSMALQRDHPYIMSAKGLGSEKWKFLLTISTISAYVSRVGGSEKVQKCADVIQGWSQRKKPQQRLCRKFFFSIQPSICISKQYFMYFFTLDVVTRLLLRSSLCMYSLWSAQASDFRKKFCLGVRPCASS